MARICLLKVELHNNIMKILWIIFNVNNLGLPTSFQCSNQNHTASLIFRGMLDKQNTSIPPPSTKLALTFLDSYHLIFLHFYFHQVRHLHIIHPEPAIAISGPSDLLTSPIQLSQLWPDLPKTTTCSGGAPSTMRGFYLMSAIMPLRCKTANWRR
jgi:hypothetical protein